MKSKLTFLLSCLMLCSGSLSLHALGQFDCNVTLPGNTWTVTLNQMSLAGGAGTNFVNQVESASMLVNIDVTLISGFSNPANWRIDIRRTDTAGPASLSIFARRTTTGTGTGTNPTGGTAICG